MAPALLNKELLRESLSAIEVIQSYIAANNRYDLEAVLNFLAEDLKVIGPNGGMFGAKNPRHRVLALNSYLSVDIWASSTTGVAPFYIKDFERAKHAELAKLINVLEIRELDDSFGVDAPNPSTQSVHCILENLGTAQIVKVTYVLRLSDGKMIKHVISSIERNASSSNASMK